MDKVVNPRSVGTHDGTFHADEVTACALLLLFNLVDEAKIVRTRDQDKLNCCEFVCDVGGIYDPQTKHFDHHQVGYQGEMSSAGMVLLYLKEQGFISASDYHFFHHSLIRGVDAHDNGIELPTSGVCTYSNVVTNFTPTVYDASPEEQNAAFFQALHFAKGHLQRLYDRHLYNASCRAIVAQSMAERKDYLMFDKGIPWQDNFFELNGAQHPALFVIMPSGKHWKLRGIPPDADHRMDVRHPLPLEWAGLIDEELKKASHIPGAIFCHKGRFISVWETKEDALQALEYVLKQDKKEAGE